MKFKASPPHKGKMKKKAWAKIEEDDAGGHKVMTGYEHTGPMMMGDHGYEAPKEKVFEKGHGHLAMAHAATHLNVPHDVDAELADAGNPDGGSGLTNSPVTEPAS